MLRITLIITALISAFFSSPSRSDVSFQKAQRDAEKSTTPMGLCRSNWNNQEWINSTVDSCKSNLQSLLNQKYHSGLTQTENTDTSIRWSTTVTGSPQCDADPNCNFIPYSTPVGQLQIQGSGESHKCPPSGSPDYTELFEVITDKGERIIKCKMPNVDEDCPEPSDSDLFTLPAASGTRCFDNTDGTTCRYKEEAGKISYKSLYYGNNEGRLCGADDDPITTPDPNIPPPVTPGKGASGNHTLPAEEHDADPSPSANQQEALDKINKNLKAITDNQNETNKVLVESQNEHLKELKLNNEHNKAAFEQLDQIKAAEVNSMLRIIQIEQDTNQLVAIESDNNRQLRAIKDGIRNSDPQLVSLNEKTKGLGVDVSTIKETTSGVKSDTKQMSETLIGIKGDTGQLVTIVGEGNELIKTMIDKMPCNPENETCPQPPVPPEPECDPEKELCKGSIKAPTEKQFDKTLSASFWESQYENGLQGVWDEKREELTNTGAIKFVEQFKVQASGSLPDTQMCFNLGGFMDFGCKALPMPDGRTLAFIKLVILISAAFACRRIIFGG